MTTQTSNDPSMPKRPMNRLWVIGLVALLLLTSISVVIFTPECVKHLRQLATKN